MSLRTMLGPLRMYFDMPTRRRKARPKKLPLKVKLRPEDDWTFVDVDQEIYPFLVLFPILTLPDEVSGRMRSCERAAKVKNLWIRGASFANGLTEHLDGLAAQLGVAAIEPTATFSAPEFFRLLAKVAHSYVAAEIGIDAFDPFLRRIICDNETSNVVQYVGGIERTEQAAT